MSATTQERGYGRTHQRIRAEVAPLVLGGGVICWRCGEAIRPGELWDLGHDDQDRRRYRGPEHRRCNRATSGRRWQPAEVAELEPERGGIDQRDGCWRVPWLRGLRRVPRDATWPRLMTVPHPRAVDSLGREFVRWAEARTGRPLRWWQKLVAARVLEVDDQGRLVWETMLLSTARQVGKSWGMRELCLWRIQQGDRFGEPQDVMHTGKDVAICKEIQRPARFWAKGQPGVYKVREVNGQEEIEYLADGSRWMLRAKEAVYGYGASVGFVDEAWKVKASSIDEGLAPTMAEREQPQLWLVSTAHRLATPLMLLRRAAALAQLGAGEGDLLIEWSAPAQAHLDDVAAWRLASPHWSPRRERLIRRQLELAQTGEILDPEEPDPVEAFKAQYMNQWPRRALMTPSNTEELLPAGLWANLLEPGTASDGPVWVAVEDDYGTGAAVAAAAILDDGRIEVDGWLCQDWDTALADVARLGGYRRIRQLQVGASMLNRVPAGTTPAARPAGARETRLGLPLLRDLAYAGELAHDESPELDQAVGSARVREGINGLTLAPVGRVDLVKALVWAVQAAHRPAPVPAVY